MERVQAQQSTSIRAEQAVGSMLGGLVASVYIQSLTGPVVVKPAMLPDPPEERNVLAYLEALKNKTVVPKRSSDLSDAAYDKLNLQWGTPFRAHRAANPSQPLEQIVDQVLDENRQRKGYLRLILLADPGSGKTPALRALAKNVATQALQMRGDQRGAGKAPDSKLVVPIYLDLCNLRMGQDIAPALAAAFNEGIEQRITPGEINGLLNSDKYTCFLLLDDLDQLLAQQQNRGFQTLCQLMETYPEHRYVVSCRTSSYRQQLGFLDVLYLDELQPAEVKEIVGETDYRILLSASKNLAHNRTVVERFIRTGAAGIAQTKGAFLQELISERLASATQEGILQDLGARMILGLLEALAFRMRVDRTHVYNERQIMLVITDFLQEWREATPWRKVVSALKDSDLLAWDQGDLWRFQDRCDEAYFAASAAIHEQNRLEILLRDASEYWWRDVIEILAGIHPDPLDLLMELIDRDVYVAANCFRHVPESASRACAEALIDALVDALWRENTPRQLHIVERLGESDHPRAPEALMQILYREWSSPVLMAALKALVSMGANQEGATITQEAIFDADKKIQISLEGQIGVVSQLLRWCWSRKSGDDEPMIAYLTCRANPARARALVALGLGLKNSHAGLKPLLELLDAKDADDKVAWCAVEAVALMTPHREVYRWAKQTASNSKGNDSTSQQRRARAVYLLGRVGSGAENGKLLFDALEDMSNDTARGYAATAIARLDLVNGRKKLEQRLAVEPEAWVLHKVAEALGQVGTLESLPFLEKHRRSQQARTRWVVRRAILEILERNELYYRS